MELVGSDFDSWLQANKLANAKNALSNLGIYSFDDLQEACEDPSTFAHIKQNLAVLDYSRLKKALNITEPLTTATIATTFDSNDQQEIPRQTSAHLKEVINNKIGTVKDGIRDSFKKGAVASEWTKMIQSLGDDTKNEFAAALGIFPGTTDYSCLIGAAKFVGGCIDGLFGTCFCGLPVCEKSCHFICFRSAESMKIIDEIKSSGIDINSLPREKKFVKAIILAYYYEALGFNNFNKIERSPVTYTFIQKSQIKSFIKEFPDYYVGVKVIRLLRAGNADFKISPPFTYKSGVTYCPGFQYCYGGSTTLATKLIRHLEDAGIPYSEVEAVINNFDKLWKEHLNTLLTNVLQNYYPSSGPSEVLMER